MAKLKEQLSQNLFEVAIQAAANGKVVARETLKVSPLLYTLRQISCLLVSPLYSPNDHKGAEGAGTTGQARPPPCPIGGLSE